MWGKLKSSGGRIIPARVRAERRAAVQAVKAVGKRRALLAADPSVRKVELDGRTILGRVVDHFSASEASARNLGLVADALEKAGIEYFLVPGHYPNRHVVAVRMAERKEFLAAMRELYRDTPLYAARPGQSPFPHDAVPYVDGALPMSLKTRKTMRFGEVLLGPGGQLLADLDYGCEVEYWRDGEDLVAADEGAERIAGLKSQSPAVVVKDSLVGPRHNPIGEVLPRQGRTPVRRTIKGRAYPAYAELLHPTIDTIDFPVDIVYTWVDGDDPVHRAKREAHRPGGPRISSKENGASRYTSHDELKYSLRSLAMYAEWVRNIYIVTDGQTPPWLDRDAPGIQVVDHKEIFADPDALPVFNSHAIGAQLHRIPGLSEHYLYFNDDVFVGRPSTPDQFFYGNGIAKLPFSAFQLGHGEPHPLEPAPNAAGKNVRKLLMGTHGKFITQKFLHTPHPQIRSVLQELEARFPEEFERTIRSRFRSITDIGVAASLHHHYAFLTGRAVQGKYKYRYVNLSHPESEERLRDLLTTRRFDFFCLNDVDTPDEEQEALAHRVRDFLESYFPFPSPYEKADQDQAAADHGAGHGGRAVPSQPAGAQERAGTAGQAG